MEVIVRLSFSFPWLTENFKDFFFNFKDFNYSDITTRQGYFNLSIIKIQAVHFHTFSIRIIKSVLGFLSVSPTQ